ncbi:hypothetical protein D1871_02955 [Nakamurella silvestris]|nr:hypothetical protein D1871_02955 [Nakamurella silvestris]
MTHYLLNIIQPDGPTPPSAELEAIMQRMTALDRELHDAGVWVYNGGLTPPDQATVTRVQDGGTTVSPGAFGDAEVHVGGFWIIDVPSVSAAQEWAARASEASTLPIEVRAILR